MTLGPRGRARRGPFRSPARLSDCSPGGRNRTKRTCGSCPEWPCEEIRSGLPHRDARRSRVCRTSGPRPGRLPAEHRPDPHRRPTREHAVGDAERPPDAPGARRRIHPCLRRQLAVLSQPDEHPHRQLLAHDGRVHQPLSDRRLRAFHRTGRGCIDHRDVAPRCRLRDGSRRQVPEPVPAVDPGCIHPSGLGSMGRPRHRWRGFLLQLRDDAERPDQGLRPSSVRLLDHGVDIVRRAFHRARANPVLPLLRTVGSAWPGQTPAGGRGEVPPPPPLSSGELQRAGHERQARMGGRPTGAHRHADRRTQTRHYARRRFGQFGIECAAYDDHNRRLHRSRHGQRRVDCTDFQRSNSQ